MRKIQLAELDNIIQTGNTKATLAILRKGRVKTYRKRPRNPGEQAVLDRLCQNSWERALKTGKVKILNRKEWYYELD